MANPFTNDNWSVFSSTNDIANNAKVNNYPSLKMALSKNTSTGFYIWNFDSS
jgi:hypothetical protein